MKKIIIGLLLFTLMIVGILNVTSVVKAASSNTEWTNVRVDDYDSPYTGNDSPAATTDQTGKIHAVWLDHRDDHYEGNDNAIYYSNSTDGGATWSRNMVVHNRPYYSSLAPSIAVCQNKIVSVFTEDYKTYATTSENDGRNWSEAVRVDPNTSVVNYMPMVVANPLNCQFYVVLEKLIGTSTVFFYRSEDGGYSWSDPVKITKRADYSSQISAKIAVDNTGVIHVVWNENSDIDPDIGTDLFYNYSPDNGRSWQQQDEIANEMGQLYHNVRSITVKEGTVYIGWDDSYFQGAESDPRVAKRNGFNNWSSYKINVGGAGTTDVGAILTVADGWLVASWINDYGSTNPILKIAKSLDGQTWQDEQNAFYSKEGRRIMNHEMTSFGGRMNLVYHLGNPARIYTVNGQYIGDPEPTDTPTPTLTPSPTPTPTPVINFPVIDTKSMPAGKVNHEYEVVIEGHDLDKEDTLTMKVTDLPPGHRIKDRGCLTLHNAGKTFIRCQMTGIPKQKGTYKLKATLTDTTGHTDEQIIPVVIFP